jgi:[ribosomal protein S18]-alanine N-acetyltransferase
MMEAIRSLFRRPEPSIAEARAGDAAALARVHASAFRHGWSETEFERLLADKTVICHIARRGTGADAIFAFTISRIVDDEAEILMVAVAPPEQGRGLAGRLLSRHLGRLAALGVRKIFLEVDEGNLRAIRLYSRAGFEQVGRRPGYYANAEEAAAALILRRSLD